MHCMCVWVSVYLSVRNVFGWTVGRSARLMAHPCVFIYMYIFIYNSEANIHLFIWFAAYFIEYFSQIENCLVGAQFFPYFLDVCLRSVARWIFIARYPSENRRFGRVFCKISARFCWNYRTPNDLPQIFVWDCFWPVCICEKARMEGETRTNNHQYKKMFIRAS